MSYCRINEDSDIYMFNSSSPGEECVYNVYLKNDDEAFISSDPYDTICLLIELRKEGHKIPEKALVRLCKDVVGSR